jgi:hypothetical protein
MSQKREPEEDDEGLIADDLDLLEDQLMREEADPPEDEEAADGIFDDLFDDEDDGLPSRTGA